MPETTDSAPATGTEPVDLQGGAGMTAVAGTAQAQAGGKLDRSAWAWALYEGGRNPYVVLCTIYVLAPYIATTVFTDPIAGQSAIADWNRNAGILVALTAPFIGAIADRYGGRKPLLLFVTVAMVPLIFALWWAVPQGQPGLPIWAIGLVIAAVGVLFAWNEVLHNSMLPSASTPATLPHTSGLALALGNLFSVLFLVVVLWAFAFPGRVDWPFVPDQPLFGLDAAAHENSRIVAPIAAVWFAIAAIPLFLFARDARRTGTRAAEAVAQGVSGLARTISRIATHHRNAGVFLIARMLYTDGKTALLIFGGVVAAGVLNWGLIEMTLYGIILSVFAVIGGLLAGVLDTRLGPKNAVILEIAVTIACLITMSTQSPTMVFGFPVEEGVKVWNSPFFATLPELVFLGGAVIVAISVTAAYASSRTMLTRLAPPGMAGEFFGLYSLAGAATAWLGPLLVGWFTTAFQSQQAGLASILILLVAGLIALMFVKPPPVPES
jgi:MFS transporter, UMF1 family